VCLQGGKSHGKKASPADQKEAIADEKIPLVAGIDDAEEEQNEVALEEGGVVTPSVVLSSDKKKRPSQVDDGLVVEYWDGGNESKTVDLIRFDAPPAIANQAPDLIHFDSIGASSSRSV
jgi:hypothetical protein